MKLNMSTVVVTMISLLMSYSISAAVIYEDVAFASNNQTFTQRLNNVDNGSYKVTLVDYAFPEAFSTLQLSIKDQSKSNLDVISGAGDTIVQSSDSTIWLSLFSEIESGLGMYGIRVETWETSGPSGGQSPVPVPASLLLLISGILPLIGIKFKSRRKVAA